MTTDNRCIHLCRAGRHILEIHSKSDADRCRRIEHDIWGYRIDCRECGWDLGMDYLPE